MFFDQFGNLLVSDFDQIRAQIENGQGFTYSTGQLNSPAGSANLGLSVFNPAASGKSILIYSIKVFYTGYAMFFLAPTAVDPALGTAANVTNALLSSAKTSIASATYSNANIASLPANNAILEGAQAAGNYTIADILANGNQIYIMPKGTANGLFLFFNSPGNNTWIATMKGIEF